MIADRDDYRIHFIDFGNISRAEMRHASGSPIFNLGMFEGPTEPKRRAKAEAAAKAWRVKRRRT